MNRYILIHRMTGPAILLLLGIVALLSQAHVVHFSIFIPLLFILLGVLKLAERAALAGWEYPGPGIGPGIGPQTPPTATYGRYGAPDSGSTSTSIVPRHDFGNGGNNGGEQ
jgi:hypothetical protein